MMISVMRSNRLQSKRVLAVKWGAAWSEGDIRFYKGNAEFHMNRYIDKRRADGRRPFIDGPHFELIV